MFGLESKISVSLLSVFFFGLKNVFVLNVMHAR